ncbi:hypothetical protein RBU49_01010 [Clostridium sp. MB40-C1]|nr:hypothetical protein [Clostridium sp. MB40-C1]WMJ80858.1 hypothetical protein RBU49_01010 [Clostridium sp. MB40-C1]
MFATIKTVKVKVYEQVILKKENDEEILHLLIVLQFKCGRQNGD